MSAEDLVQYASQSPKHFTRGSETGHQESQHGYIRGVVFSAVRSIGEDRRISNWKTLSTKPMNGQHLRLIEEDTLQWIKITDKEMQQKTVPPKSQQDPLPTMP